MMEDGRCLDVTAWNNHYFFVRNYTSLVINVSIVQKQCYGLRLPAIILGSGLVFITYYNLGKPPWSYPSIN